MKVFDLNPEIKWLLLFPHPDDELAICTWISRLTESNCQVACLWLHSTPTRKAESLNVARKLGVDLGRVLFLEAKDGAFHKEWKDLLNPVEAFAKEILPDRLVVPAFEQGHVDHDTVHYLGSQIAKRLKSHPNLLEYPLYSPYTTSFPKVNQFSGSESGDALLLTPDERRLKRKLIQGYPSQTIRRNLIFAETRSRLVWRRSLLARELLRFAPEYDYKVPSVPGVGDCAKWKDWQDGIFG